MADMIVVENLKKDYGDVKAVDGISFEVKEGEIFGLLGPNGAGKTTTIKMLTTLLKPTAGHAKIAGFDILKDSTKVRENIGIVFQDPSLDEDLTARENLEFHAILYKMGKEQRERKIAEVLKLIELEDKADVLVKNYSGGLKRRLEIGRGLIHEPKVLFLDEPTLGLDAQTRRHIWEYIKKLNDQQKITLILTTHYMEEADYLSSRIAFVDHGKIVALDTSKALKNKLGGDVISVQFNKGVEELAKHFKSLKWVKTVARHGDFLDLTVMEGETKIPEVIKIAERRKATVISVNLHKPSLEDVFIYFTGKTIREEAGDQFKEHMRSRMRRRG